MLSIAVRIAAAALILVVKLEHLLYALHEHLADLLILVIIVDGSKDLIIVLVKLGTQDNDLTAVLKHPLCFFLIKIRSQCVVFLALIFHKIQQLKALLVALLILELVKIRHVFLVHLKIFFVAHNSIPFPLVQMSNDLTSAYRRINGTLHIN